MNRDNASIKGTLWSAKPGCWVAQLVKCLVTSGYPDGWRSGDPSLTKLVTEKKTAECLIKTDILQSWSKNVKRKTAFRGGVSVKTPTWFGATRIWAFHAQSCSFLFFSRPRYVGWPHHGRNFSIYPHPLSFWLTLPRRVLSTSWCCQSKPCVAFLSYVHLALFLASSLSPSNSLVSSWCDHSMLPSLHWRCLTVPSLLQLC